MSQHGTETSGPDGRVRDLGASECLVYLLNKGYGSSHLVRVFEFDGAVDPALMERAFRQMVARRPLLQTTIPPTAEGEWPYLRLDDSQPSFTVRPRTGPTQWIDLFSDELTTQLGVDGDPPIRVQLLTSDEPGGELLVSCAHTFCDGRSLFRFCRDMLREYEALVRGEEGDPNLGPSEIRPAVEQLLPEWCTPDVGQKLVADHMARVAELPAPIPWPSERGGSSAPKTSRMTPFGFPSDVVAGMRANARANGTTVFGVLGASAVLATEDVLKTSSDDHIVVTSTLDIRDALRVPVAIEDMGIYAAVTDSRHTNVAAMSEWDHARDFKNQISAAIDRHDHYTWIFIGSEFVKQVSGAATAPLFTDTLANLGAIDIPTEGTSLRVRTARGALGTHHAAYGYMCLNGVTINGNLAMTNTYTNPDISESRARDFIAAMSDRVRWFARPDT